MQAVEDGNLFENDDGGWLTGEPTQPQTVAVVAHGHDPLAILTQAAAVAYLNGPTKADGSVVRPGTQTIAELIENAATYIVSAGAAVTEAFFAHAPALDVTFTNRQTGIMAFETDHIEIWLNDLKGFSIDVDYTEVRWQWDAGADGKRFNGGWPFWRKPLAGIDTWLPVDLQTSEK